MDIDELVAMGRDEEDAAGKQAEQAPKTKQESLEGERLPSLEQDTNPLLQGMTAQAKPSILAPPPPGFTLPEGWTIPAPDTSGAPLNRVINAAYQQIHGVYEAVKGKESAGELTPERAAELIRCFNAVLASEKVVNAEEAITREFRAFQDAVKGTHNSGVTDHKGKAAAAGNVRAGCAWLVKYVRWFVWNEEAGG